MIPQATRACTPVARRDPDRTPARQNAALITPPPPHTWDRNARKLGAPGGLLALLDAHEDVQQLAQPRMPSRHSR
jgi:hypothetical protein